MHDAHPLEQFRQAYGEKKNGLQARESSRMSEVKEQIYDQVNSLLNRIFENISYNTCNQKIRLWKQNKWEMFDWFLMNWWNELR